MNIFFVLSNNMKDLVGNEYTISGLRNFSYLKEVLDERQEV